MRFFMKMVIYNAYETCNQEFAIYDSQRAIYI